MKKNLLIIILILLTLKVFSQGQITFGQDTVNIMGKLKLMKLQQGSLTDSLMGKKINGSTTRLAMNQITPSFSNIIGRPTSLAGYGILDAYPLSGNPSGFVINTSSLTINGVSYDLSANRSWSVGDLLSSGSYTNPSWIVSLPYSKITGQPSLYAPIAGQGISITGSYPNQTITNISPYILPTANSISRTLNSNYTISTTKQATVNYSISLSVTNPLLVGNSTAAAYLEYSINNGSSWVPVSDGLIASSVGVTVTVAITNTQTQILSGTIPANALVRIRTTTTGTASIVYVRGQETY